jgi:4'-phosphopantetheinyl transferase EntD
MRTTEHSTTKPADASIQSNARAERYILPVTSTLDNKRLPIRCCALSCASERNETMMRAEKELRQRAEALKHSECEDARYAASQAIERADESELDEAFEQLNRAMWMAAC